MSYWQGRPTFQLGNPGAMTRIGRPDLPVATKPGLVSETPGITPAMNSMPPGMVSATPGITPAMMPPVQASGGGGGGMAPPSLVSTAIPRIMEAAKQNPEFAQRIQALRSQINSGGGMGKRPVDRSTMGATPSVHDLASSPPEGGPVFKGPARPTMGRPQGRPPRRGRPDRPGNSTAKRPTSAARGGWRARLEAMRAQNQGGRGFPRSGMVGRGRPGGMRGDLRRSGPPAGSKNLGWRERLAMR